MLESAQDAQKRSDDAVERVVPPENCTQCGERILAVSSRGPSTHVAKPYGHLITMTNSQAAQQQSAERTDRQPQPSQHAGSGGRRGRD